MNKAFNKQSKTKWAACCNAKILVVRNMINETIKNMHKP